MGNAIRCSECGTKAAALFTAGLGIVCGSCYADAGARHRTSEVAEIIDLVGVRVHSPDSGWPLSGEVRFYRR